MSSAHDNRLCYRTRVMKALQTQGPDQRNGYAGIIARSRRTSLGTAQHIWRRRTSRQARRLLQERRPAVHRPLYWRASMQGSSRPPPVLQLPRNGRLPAWRQLVPSCVVAEVKQLRPTVLSFRPTSTYRWSQVLKPMLYPSHAVQCSGQEMTPKLVAGPRC